MTHYSVFSYVKDRIKGESVPVGVAVWSPDADWHRVRFAQAGEQLTGLSPNDYLPVLTLIEDILEHWTESGRLPYAQQPLPPSSDEWWQHVRKLLNHEIVLSEPRELPEPALPTCVEDLYLSVLAPYRPGGMTLLQPHTDLLGVMNLRDEVS